jgi:hypothetical protein
VNFGAAPIASSNKVALDVLAEEAAAADMTSDAMQAAEAEAMRVAEAARQLAQETQEEAALKSEIAKEATKAAHEGAMSALSAEQRAAEAHERTVDAALVAKERAAAVGEAERSLNTFSTSKVGGIATICLGTASHAEVLADLGTMNVPGRSGASALSAVTDGVELSLRSRVQADGSTISLGNAPADASFSRDLNVPGRGVAAVKSEADAQLGAGCSLRTKGALGSMFVDAGSSENDASVLNCNNNIQMNDGACKAHRTPLANAVPVLLG